MSSSVSNGKFVPLSANERESAIASFTKYALAVHGLEQAKAKMAAGEAKIAAGEAKIAAAQAKIAEGQKELEAAQAKIASGQAKIASGQAKIAAAEQGRQFLRTRLFCSALGLPSPKQDEVDKIEIFTAYFTSDDINRVNEKVTLFSTKPFEKYLELNSNTVVKKLNLSAFQAITNISEVFEFLSKASIPELQLNSTFKATIDSLPQQNRIKVTYQEK